MSTAGDCPKGASEMDGRPESNEDDLKQGVQRTQPDEPSSKESLQSRDAPTQNAEDTKEDDRELEEGEPEHDRKNALPPPRRSKLRKKKHKKRRKSSPRSVSPVSVSSPPSPIPGPSNTSPVSRPLPTMMGVGRMPPTGIQLTGMRPQPTDGIHPTGAHIVNVRTSGSDQTSSYSESDSESDEGPRQMIAGFKKYTRKLERRVRALEKSRETKDSEGSTGSSSSGSDETRDSNEGITSIRGKRSFSMEIKFFDAKGEIRGHDWVPGRFTVTGSYQSKVDTNHFMRVLCTPVEGADPVNPEGPAPEPGRVDIITFAVLSAPIKSYFSSQLGMAMSPGPLKMAKPFRPVLQTLDALRIHVSELENRLQIASLAGQNMSGGESPRSRANGPNILPRAGSIDGGMSDGDTNDGSTAENSSVIQAPSVDLNSENLKHFQLFLKFVDDYLERPIRLYERIKAGIQAEICFEDLWMLFDSGQTVYSSCTKGGLTFPGSRHNETFVTKARYTPQAFRVWYIEGGLPQTWALLPTMNAGNNMADESWPAHSRNRHDQKRRDGRTTAFWRKRDQYSNLMVKCFHIDFNGEKYGIVPEVFCFRPFDGMVEVTSLEAYPIQYAKHRGLCGSAHSQLLERGKMFVDVTSVSHLSYDGLTVGPNCEKVDSAVIVDFNLAFREYKHRFLPNQIPMFGVTYDHGPHRVVLPVCRWQIWGGPPTLNTWDHRGSFCRYASVTRSRNMDAESKLKGQLEDFEVDNTKDVEKIKFFLETHDLLALLPGVVPGFALRNRKWVQLDLSGLTQITQEDEWKNLVLPKGHARMVRAMVETHTRGLEHAGERQETVSLGADMDLVRGKGKGCIILLHGVPGVGKTSTAECVAAYTGRPLYPITCGDIGYIPEDVEKNMEEHFKLAHKWGCVLLLDEADVFLAKRDKTDVKRNGLVSVFLRILEYYSGILFLTTNRVGSIDDAFRSRLHLTLYYPSLTKKRTVKIWENNLDRIEKMNEVRRTHGQPPIVFEREKIMKWVTKKWNIIHWNGRQIRNAFQTAIALADFKAKRKTEKGGGDQVDPPLLTTKLFGWIAEAAMQFDEYMDTTLGSNAEAIANRDRMRAAKFEAKPQFKGLKGIESSSSSSESSESESGSCSDSESSDDEPDSEADESGEESSSDESEGGAGNKKKKNKKQKKHSKKEAKSKKSKGKEKHSKKRAGKSKDQ